MKFYVVDVDCGETTCAKAKGEFCNHLGVKNFGTTPVCTLFQDKCGNDVRLFDADGWLQRCSQCIENVK